MLELTKCRQKVRNTLGPMITHGGNIDHLHHLQGAGGPFDRRTQQTGDAVGCMEAEEDVPRPQCSSASGA